MNRDDIIALLAPLRLRGNNLIAHVSVSSLGTVDGGARTLCEALVEAVSASGTIVVPTFTYETFVEVGPPRRRSLAYHPDLPVSREIGAFAETFRKQPGVIRSNHPTHSFAAWGRLASTVLSTQRDNNPLGPLKKLNVLQGHVLLLGSGLTSATAIHLAEEQTHAPYLARRTALRINDAGHEERVVLELVPGCSLSFSRLEAQLESDKYLGVPLSRGEARKFPIRYLLTLATAALQRDPGAFVCDECPSCREKRHCIESARDAG